MEVVRPNEKNLKLDEKSTARRFANCREEILKTWEQRVREQIPPAQSESRSALRDSLPHFLSDLEQALRSTLQELKPNLVQDANEHGADRANSAIYSIEDALTEFNILRKVIFEALETKGQLSPRDRDIIYEAINLGQLKAGGENARLQIRREKDSHFEAEKEREKLLAVENEARRLVDISTKRLTNLHAVTEAALSRTMNVHDILEDVLTYVQRALECDTVEIFLLAEDSRFLEVRASRGVGEALEKRERIPLEQGVCGKIFSSGQAMKINNLSEMDVASPMLRKNLKSLVGCPLRTTAGSIGVMHAGRTSKRNPFDDSDLIYLQLIADRLATAIDNANLYKRAETTVETLQQEREVREKFVNTLTHDLRTPLTAAMMSAQLIIRKIEDVNAIQSLAVKIVDNVNRADRMIHDLLDANRIHAGQLIQANIEPIDLVEVVKRSLSDLVMIHGDRFILNAPKELAANLCANGMRRTVENLCMNAVKYGRPDGQITVGIEDHGSHVSLCVHNYGEPLSDKDKDKLFNQFQRLSAAETSGKKGWGIGLTIVKGVAEAHGGKAEVESAKDGTIFRVTLPKNAQPLQSK